VLREDLRNFKRVMEIGEPLTILGSPRGRAPVKACGTARRTRT
jgi:hypothetical protein